jgi:hypothetical protein
MPLHLIIQYCNDPRPARQAEYDQCVGRNLDNAHIAAVHNLVEPTTRVPETIRVHQKYREQPLSRWMTYRDAFAFANADLAGEVVAIANLDIFLDPTSPWDRVAEVLDPAGIVLCLSRIEFTPVGPPFKDPQLDQMAFANSQDAWVFRAPLEVPDCDFEIGTLGCDNAIAQRIKDAGRIPVNLAERFRIFHYDLARGKTFANHAQVHAAEAATRPHPHPERQGQYLVPNMDQVKSVDELLEALKVSDLQRYMVICDVLSFFVKVGNK